MLMPPPFHVFIEDAAFAMPLHAPALRRRYAMPMCQLSMAPFSRWPPEPCRHADCHADVTITLIYAEFRLLLRATYCRLLAYALRHAIATLRAIVCHCERR